MKMRLWFGLAAGIALALPATAWAGSAASTAGDTGISALWILANISFAGMRAQDHPSAIWRMLAFFFGFPGTLLTFFIVDEGSCLAYGIALPRRIGR